MTPEHGSQTEPAKSPLEKAEEVATREIEAGFSSFEDVIERVVQTIDECSTDRDSDPETAREQDARRIVTRLWDERLHKQNDWPSETDADRIERAFAALEKKNILTRMNFTCCNTCGGSELWGEWQDEDKGYAFFHEQSMETAINDGKLYINFDSFIRSEPRKVEVGRTIVRLLKQAGLSVKWDKDPNKKIVVEPVRWLRRLPLDEDDEEADSSHQD